MKGRAIEGRALIAKTGPFMRNKHVPVPIKVAIVKGIVAPKLLYGAEAYGVCRRITNSMQVFMNETCRMVVGLNTKASVPNAALWQEVGVSPICASAAALRTRAILKIGSLNTFVRELSTTPFRSRFWTRITGGGKSG